MTNNKKIAIISLFSILWSTNASAFTQNYTPADPNMIYQTYFDMINIGPSWSNDIKVNKEVVIAVLT